MQAKLNSEYLKKKCYSGDLLVDGRILKFLLKTQVVRGWIGFSHLEIGANDIMNMVKISFFFFLLHSWDRASLMYSSKTNKMQRYTMVFITINVLHVSGCSTAHHQELKTVYTASGIYRAFCASYRYRE